MNSKKIVNIKKVEDVPVYVGRFNLGAISIHFPMIIAKSMKNYRDPSTFDWDSFIKELNYYLEIIRNLHKKTFEFLSHKKAGTNPLGFCEGGFLNGYKDYDEELGEEFLKPMTLSFGIIALNEASVIATGKSIAEDNSFSIKILNYMNSYLDKIKKEDGLLYALYGTPGESLVSTMVQQFRKKYGIVERVSDHEYMTNSFHCAVYENITQIEKQDIETPMHNLVNGGNIGYCRMNIQYNLEANKTLIKRAMDRVAYFGLNQELDYCEHCGEQFIDKNCCPKCGSEDITRIERMNGYLSYSKIRGRTMYADHKLVEFSERKSM